MVWQQSHGRDLSPFHIGVVSIPAWAAEMQGGQRLGVFSVAPSNLNLGSSKYGLILLFSCKTPGLCTALSETMMISAFSTVSCGRPGKPTRYWPVTLGGVENPQLEQFLLQRDAVVVNVIPPPPLCRPLSSIRLVGSAPPGLRLFI